MGFSHDIFDMPQGNRFYYMRFQYYIENQRYAVQQFKKLNVRSLQPFIKSNWNLTIFGESLKYQPTLNLDKQMSDSRDRQTVIQLFPPKNQCFIDRHKKDPFNEQ